MIKLNEAERRLAIYVAKKRYSNNRAKGRHDGKIGPQSNWETDLEGIAAEIAFCKHMNVYPDLEVDSDGELPDWDCAHPIMGRVDVKGTKYGHGRLLAVKSKSNHPADSYALMIGAFPSYKYVGWAKAADLFKDQNITNLGHGEGYAMTQENLTREKSQ